MSVWGCGVVDLGGLRRRPATGLYNPKAAPYNHDMNSGAIGGALDSDSDRAAAHAERYYGLVRSMTTDCAKIAKNTGFSEEEILAVKKYLFVDEHILSDRIGRFHPHYSIAESWRRLIDGKNIKEQDIILIRHELLEIEMVRSGATQDEAHIAATQLYNYTAAFLEGR